MAADEKKLIFQIQLEGSEKSRKEIEKLEKRMQTMTKKQKHLNDEKKKNKKLNKEQIAQQSRLRTSMAKVSAERSKEIRDFNSINQSTKKLGFSYNDLVAKNKALSAAARKLANPLTKDKKKFDQLTASMKKNTNALKKMDSSMGRSFRNVGNYKSAISGLAGAFGVGLTGMALVGALKGVITMIGEFEQKMATLKAISGATETELTALSNSAQALGASSMFTAGEVGQLQIEFAKLGFKTDEILDATAATLNLATATGEDLAQAAIVAASTVRGFGLEAEDTGKVTDVMAASFSSSALDLNKFQTAMATVAPVAKNAGATIEQTTAIIAKVADAGVDASTAGTALRNIFLELAKKGLTFDEAMKKIQLSTNKNKTAMELFGKRGATVAAIISENTEEIKEMTKAFENSAGAAKRMADIVGNTLQGDVKRLESAWEGLVLSLDDGTGKLSGAIKGILHVTTDLLLFLTGAKEESQQLAEAFEKLSGEIDYQEQHLRPLIDEYDLLSRKAVLNKDEQIKLKKIIGEIATEMPSAVTQWDEYGNAIELSTGKVKENMNILKERARVTNKLRILELKEEQKSHKLEIQRNINLIKRGKAKWSQSKEDIVFIKLTNKAEKATIAKNAELRKEIALKSVQLEQLGETITEEQRAFAIAEGMIIVKKELTAKELKAAELRAKLAAQALLDEKNALAIEEKAKKARELEIKAIQKLQKEIAKLIKEEESRVTTEKEYHDNFEKGLRERSGDNGDYWKAVEKNMMTGFEAEIAATKQTQKELDKIKTDAFNTEMNQKKMLKDAAFQFATDSINNIFTLNQRSRDRNLKADIDALRLKAETGLITEEAYELGAENIRKEGFERQKAADMAQALINGALAITKTIAQLGGVQLITPWGAAAIGITAAATAVQVGMINAQQYAQGGILGEKFAEGGLVHGKSHAQGGETFNMANGGRVELEGGEAVINKKGTKKFRSVLSAINSSTGGKKFAEGGMMDESIFKPAPVVPFGLAVPFVNRELLRLHDRIDTLKVTNVVTETTTQQNNVKNIEHEASI